MKNTLKSSLLNIVTYFLEIFKYIFGTKSGDIAQMLNMFFVGFVIIAKFSTENYCFRAS